MFDQFTFQQISFFVVLASAFWLLLTEWIRPDLVAVLIILALAILKIIKPAEALAGFGSEPAIVVASIFVLSAALHQTGVSEAIGAWVGRLAGNNYPRMLSVMMSGVALGSAFTHHVTTTAIMLPVMLNWSREHKVPASKLLMPVSFAASLGTAITIIGAPAFLVASAALHQAGRPGLGIFSIAPIGLSITAAGILFTLLIGRYLLPAREGTSDVGNRFRIDHYFTELTILSNSSFVDKTLAEIKAKGEYHFTVVGWLRNKQPLPHPLGQWRLATDDVLLVHTTPDDMIAFRQTQGIELHPVQKYGAELTLDRGKDYAEHLIQAVVAPKAEFIGRTLRQIDFRRQYGPIVVGLWRQSAFLNQELASIELHAGDVLVLQGDDEALARVESDPSFLMLVPFHGEARLRRKAPLAAGIMLAAIILAAFSLLTIDIAMLAGAAAVILSGCLTMRQAYRAIDTRIYVFIAGAIPLGTAMQQTGAAKLLAGLLQHALSNWSEVYVLLMLFAVVGLVTQLMSDAATVALFAPIAIALAQGLGHAPEPYVVTVAMAAVTAFFTPMGHHGNLLVYGPGNYQFQDFVRVGGLLTLVIAVIVAFLSQSLWHL